MKTWAVAALLLSPVVAGPILVACTKREEARDAYSIQSHACVVAFDGNPPKQRECVEYVRARWSQLGAPPAAVGDAGHE